MFVPALDSGVPAAGWCVPTGTDWGRTLIVFIGGRHTVGVGPVSLFRGAFHWKRQGLEVFGGAGEGGRRGTVPHTHHSP